MNITIGFNYVTSEEQAARVAKLNEAFVAVTSMEESKLFNGTPLTLIELRAKYESLVADINKPYELHQAGMRYYLAVFDEAVAHGEWSEAVKNGAIAASHAETCFDIVRYYRRKSTDAWRQTVINLAVLYRSAAQEMELEAISEMPSNSLNN